MSRTLLNRVLPRLVRCWQRNRGGSRAGAPPPSLLLLLLLLLLLSLPRTYCMQRACSAAAGSAMRTDTNQQSP
jgi:hypothetical protein